MDESKVEEPIDRKFVSKDTEEEIDDHPTSVVVTLPNWATQFYGQRKKKVYRTEEEMMEVAMELSKINCERNTGGPFGTAIFEHDPKTKESKLFTVGVNRVVPCSNSTLHGEMTAIQFGQQKIRNFSFAEVGARKSKEYHLYTSCAPCYPVWAAKNSKFFLCRGRSKKVEGISPIHVMRTLLSSLGSKKFEIFPLQRSEQESR